MKILAFLQNQWFKDPARVKQIYDARPMRRRDLNRAFLFAGCLTGRRLKAAFGDDLCRQIVWEEISLEVGSKSHHAFLPDHEHIKKAIEEIKPDYIIAFGSIARMALASHCPTLAQMNCPHPAARGKQVPLELKAAASLLRERIKEFDNKCRTCGQSVFDSNGCIPCRKKAVDEEEALRQKVEPKHLT